jgi:hypothetical protein
VKRAWTEGPWAAGSRVRYTRAYHDSYIGDDEDARHARVGVVVRVDDDGAVFVHWIDRDEPSDYPEYDTDLECVSIGGE